MNRNNQSDKAIQREPTQASARPESGKHGRIFDETIDEDLGVKIYQTAASPSYYVQYNEPEQGQKKTSLRTRNVKEARRKAWAIVTRLQKGESTPARKKSPKIAAEITSFLENKLRIGNKQQTVKEYRRWLNQFEHFLTRSRVTRLNQVTTDHLEEFELELRETGILVPRSKGQRGAKARPNSGGTVLEKIKIIKGVFKWAMRRGHILHNPIVGYELPADSESNSYSFTHEEVPRICKASDWYFSCVFGFLACMGLRQSELRWSMKTDLDLQRRKLKVGAKTLIEDGIEWSPKGDDRVVPLCDAAVEIAKRVLALPGKWLFPSPTATASKDVRMSDFQLRSALRKAKQAAGVERGTLHSFRHYFVSTMANANISPFKVMKMVGHKSLDIVLRYYHVDQEELLSAVTSVDFGVETALKNPK